MSVTIELVSRPSLIRGPGSRRRFAEEALKVLQARPNQWARIKTYQSPTGAWTSAQFFRKQHLLPGCELRAQKEGDSSVLYARYVRGGR
jgi:hypothetical protein